jgi:hypothetical protein
VKRKVLNPKTLEASKFSCRSTPRELGGATRRWPWRHRWRQWRRLYISIVPRPLQNPLAGKLLFLPPPPFPSLGLGFLLCIQAIEELRAAVIKRAASIGDSVWCLPVMQKVFARLWSIVICRLVLIVAVVCVWGFLGVMEIGMARVLRVPFPCISIWGLLHCSYWHVPHLL